MSATSDDGSIISLNNDQFDDNEFYLQLDDISNHQTMKNFPFSRKATSDSLNDTDTDGEDEEDQSPVDVDESRFISKQSSYEERIPPNAPTVAKLPSAGPSNRQVMASLKSANFKADKKDNLNSLSDSDESDEMGITRKKKSVIAGEYDATQYDNLDVSDEIREIFQYITKYTPQHLNLDSKFKPFVPDFIPAVGDIDAFLKIVPPEKTLSGQPFHAENLNLGLAVLDEPASNQSDPALLHLQLRASSINASQSNQVMVVKKVEDLENNSKVVDKWIKDVAELHRNKVAATVKYTNPMPDLDELMQEWPEEIENAIKKNDIPSSDFCGPLSQYVDVICSVFDIPVYSNKIHSLHLLFSLYASIRNSQLYKGSVAAEDKEGADVQNNNKSDHLVLE